MPRGRGREWEGEISNRCAAMLGARRRERPYSPGAAGSLAVPLHGIEERAQRDRIGMAYQERGLARERVRKRVALQCRGVVDDVTGRVREREAKLQIGREKIKTLVAKREGHAASDLRRVCRLDDHFVALVAHEEEEPIESSGHRPEPA